MLGLLSDFITELRAAGVPISLVETLDATLAMEVIDWSDREYLRSALSATLIKQARYLPAFHSCFDIYFGLGAASPSSKSPEKEPENRTDLANGSAGGGTGGETEDLDQLVSRLVAALAEPDQEEIRQLLAQAVEQLAGMEPGRPVVGTYYLYRTLRQLDLDRVERLLRQALELTPSAEPLDQRMADDLVAERLNLLREQLTGEIRRRLVADRGRVAVARTLRPPLLEEIDLMHASRAELREIEQLIVTLTRRLATKLARKRRHRSRGRLDFRKTVWASLSSGGIPLEPKFRMPHPHRPEIMMLCDISGSMATFARFALQFTWAMSTQFSRLRSLVFVDAVDEITDWLQTDRNFGQAIAQVLTQAEVTWMDGHSDYGNVFLQVQQRFGREITPKTTLIITGDARNNYRGGGEEYLAGLSEQSREVYWLNPEPKPYWDTGDSIMHRFSPFCDGVFEVRNLAQLEKFIESITLPHPSTGRRTRRTALSISSYSGDWG